MDDERSTVFEPNVSRYPTVSTATHRRVYPTGIQSRDDPVNAKVNASDLAVEGHTHLVFVGFVAPRLVAMLAG